MPTLCSPNELETKEKVRDAKVKKQIESESSLSLSFLIITNERMVLYGNQSSRETLERHSNRRDTRTAAILYTFWPFCAQFISSVLSDSPTVRRGAFDEELKLLQLRRF